MKADTKTLLVVGGGSEIIRSTILCFHKEGYKICFTSSSQESLDKTIQGFKENIPQIKGYKLDLMQDTASATFAGILKKEQPDVLIVASGYLPVNNQLLALKRTLTVNFTAVAEILACAAEHFTERKSGTVIVLSSVAGDRGRFSNFVYGSAKAGLTAFLSGFRAYLFHHGVHVMTVKPGIVSTRMTQQMMGYKKSLLWSDPDKVGRQIFTAFKMHRNVVYIPGFWWLIMTIIKLIPESIFKQLKI